MLKADYKFNFKAPRLIFQDDLAWIAKNIFVPDIQGRITRSITIDNGKFPPLEPETIKMKGHDKPLIDTKQLLNSIYYKKKGRYSVIVSFNENRKKIAEYLQIDGINSKRGKKFFRFFGISELAEKQAISHIRNKIREAIRNAK